MTHFDINKVIEHYGLDTNEVAKVVFPKVNYPKVALNRVLKGEAALSVEQLESLAEFIGVLPGDLFELSQWKGTTEDSHLVFKRGDYTVRLNYKGAYITISKNNEIIYQEITGDNKTVTEFINHIDQLIKNYENGNN